ncbi:MULTISPECIES: response regulator FixJ [Filomicrobium]|uniref:Two component transcriptional regulator, LuxR family n=1 Tax=Filomicrobium insigne TaxID=418854 RepID=A0A1H0QS14_9HYPH|nr:MULTISPECIES: response regulator FixJ [Filomicrobium]MCV0369538.1 response regulator [Filomicrobium sp.]SDP20141.1 two component transcriptional regulator, LuxR family [Filomicrobium insigne]
MGSDIVVHIVDDEEDVRTSVAFLLTTSGHTVRVHESAMEFLNAALTGNLQNDCLITDLRMPDISGVELLRRLREADAMLPAIVITGHGDVSMAVEAMKTGALDFIEKPFEEQVLLNAIKHAASELKNRPRDIDDIASIRARLDSLTDRERQVMEGVVAGQPNKTIAFELNISPRTVEVHRANVMAKMQVKSLPELVRLVLAANASD